MPGRVVNLDLSAAQPPDIVVVDSSVVIERLLAAYLSTLPNANLRQAQRTATFFSDLSARDGIGIVTPTVFQELMHKAIEFRYRQELRVHGPALRQRYGPLSGWRDLFKVDPVLLQTHASDLERLRQLLIVNHLLIVNPEELGPITSGQSHDIELIDLIRDFGVDAADASILLEARRLDVSAIVTFDPDFQRAQRDFEIFTWL